MIRLFGNVFLAILIVESSLCEVVVNEALVNEPGALVKAEWIEIYNGDSAGVWLDNFALKANGQWQTIPSGHFLNGKEYLVLVRDSLTFESIWGDSSGEWGDDPALENYPVIELPFGLVNSSGSAILASPLGDSSVLYWSSGGTDGVSWERIQQVDSVAVQSAARSGSTPGKRNSVTALDNDLAVGDLTWTRSGNQDWICVTVVNRGSQLFDADSMALLLDPIVDSGVSSYPVGELLQDFLVSAVWPNDSEVTCIELSPPGFYAKVGAVIYAADDDITNNYIIRTIPGDQFPAVVVNEFLADPEPGGSAEWIELRNVSNVAIDLGGWRIGDSLNVTMLDSVAFSVDAREYVILAQDRIAFLSHFAAFGGDVIEVSPWRALNNSGDQIRLFDWLGFLSDSALYSSAWGDGVTWSRVETEFGVGEWGRSREVGGTPGKANDVLLTPVGSNLDLRVTPSRFSPDGDGIDDLVELEISGVSGGSMRVEIYDSHGVLIRSLFEGKPFTGVLSWDGTTDSGRRVGLGIYVVYVTVDGESAKRALVVAR